ncbi:PD-(D/E)XK nuclease family protein, partial [Sorangium cellulosum]|uniref:PD-(D/E)XK nuclease family protein n=1 Tax=Sorangium cellulosum TaxID=56 RepID=UPI003B968534
MPAASIDEATVESDPEWRIDPKPRFIYPDLVISVPVPEKRLVVVIENKIDARDHEGQSHAYREYAGCHGGSCGRLVRHGAATPCAGALLAFSRRFVPAWGVLEAERHADARAQRPRRDVPRTPGARAPLARDAP